MASTRDSIENCTICQNSRNKHFLIAPQNYNHIFGYIGPASKYNLNDLLNSKENITSNKKHKKHLKKCSSRHSKIIYSKNLDLKKDNSQKWIQPGMFLYNVESHKCDKTKMRYDESDTDFEDLKNPLPRSTTSHKNKNKNKGKVKRENSRKKIESNMSHDSDNTYGKYSSTAIYCISNDSIAQNKSKNCARKTDSEDMHPLKIVQHNNCKKIRTAIKNKLPVIDSDFSVDSTCRLNRRRRIIKNTSTSSMKMKNLKSAITNLFGSIESMKNNKRRNYVSNAIDPEDIDPRIIKGCIKAKMKKPATAFTNSDFSLNSNNDCNKKKKKHVARNKKSDSSTNLNTRSKLKQSVFSSIESMKCGKKSKRKLSTTVDKEDEMLFKNVFPQIARKKTAKGKDPSIKKKKKKNLSKCYICMDNKHL